VRVAQALDGAGLVLGQQPGAPVVNAGLAGDRVGGLGAELVGDREQAEGWSPSVRTTVVLPAASNTTSCWAAWPVKVTWPSARPTNSRRPWTVASTPTPGKAMLVAGGQDRAGQGVLALGLHRGSQRQHLVGSVAIERKDVGELGAATGEGAGLVQRHHPDPGEGLQVRPPLMRMPSRAPRETATTATGTEMTSAHEEDTTSTTRPR